MSIVTFSGLQPHPLCSGECRSAPAEQRLRTIRAEGATPLFDTLTSVAKDVSGRYRPEVRPVVILLSDGNDTISRSSRREILASGAILYAVSPNPEVEAAPMLREIAEATGGRVLSWENKDFLETILAEQRASYVVTYALPSRQKGFHSLRILPKHNLGLLFHCRRGYYYEEVR